MSKLPIFYSSHDINKTFDLIICCGKGIGPNGEIDWVLEARIKLAIELFSRSNKSRLVLTGGIGLRADKDGKNMTEAQAMFIYIQNHFKVDESRIILETQSEGSLQQLCYIKRDLIIKSDYKCIALVTDKFHINRMSILFDAVMGEGYDVYYFGSEILLYGKYRQLIQDFEEMTEKEAVYITSLVNRGRDDLLLSYDKVYRELRRERLTSGGKTTESLGWNDVFEYMKQKGIKVK